MPQPTNQPNIPPRRRRARADSGMKARTMFCVAVFIIAGFGLLIYQLMRCSCAMPSCTAPRP